MTRRPRIYLTPRAWLAVLAALCLVFIVAAVRPTAAHAARGMEVAIEDEPIFAPPTSLRILGLQRSAEVSASRMRINLIWAGVNGAAGGSRRAPRRVVYSYPNLDSLVINAAQFHVKIQLTLTGPAPAWATSNKRVGNTGPNAAAYADWVRQTVSHFRGKIDRYSIWNEPNLCVWLQARGESRNRCPRSPTTYRTLYQAAYKAAKAADPGAQILIGETSPYAALPGLAPLAWLRKVAAPGVRLKADGYAHHPYDFLHSPDYRYPGGNNVTIGTLPRLTNLLSGLASSGRLRGPSGALNVYLTEFGYYHVGPRKQSEARRIKWENRAFDIAGRTPRVKEMLQYMLCPLVRNPGGRSWDTSLLGRNCVRTNPWNAFVKWTQGAVRSGLILKPT